jgi:hypothetical protein
MNVEIPIPAICNAYSAAVYRCVWLWQLRLRYKLARTCKLSIAGQDAEGY